ncbi:MAG: DUF3568 family protein [Candidatus Omnitrophota bacterium]
MMMRNIFLSIFLIVNSGCAAAIVGGAAVGAVAVSQDFATTSVDVNYKRAWSIANEQLKKIGEAKRTFQKIGEINAIVEGSTVRVKISKLTERTVDIKVSARKNMLPNTELAQTILAAILRKLQ